MSRFSNLAKDKNTFLNAIISNRDIMKAVVYNQNDFLDQLDVNNPEDYVYENVFPHRFIPDTNEQKKTIITMSFGAFKPIKGSFKSGIVTFTVLTHQDLFRTDYGILRHDFIIQRLDELFNGKGVGLGKMEFYTMDEVSLNERYHGAYISFKMYDFN